MDETKVTEEKLEKAVFKEPFSYSRLFPLLLSAPLPWAADLC